MSLVALFTEEKEILLVLLTRFTWNHSSQPHLHPGQKEVKAVRACSFFIYLYAYELLNYQNIAQQRLCSIYLRDKMAVSRNLNRCLQYFQRQFLSTQTYLQHLPQHKHTVKKNLSSAIDWAKVNFALASIDDNRLQMLLISRKPYEWRHLNILWDKVSEAKEALKENESQTWLNFLWNNLTATIQPK